MNYIKLLFDLYCLKKNEHKSVEQIKVLQRKKLNKLFKYAYRNSVYYRKAFEAVGISDRNLCNVPFSKILTIDKNALLENFDDLITVSDISQEEIRRFDEQKSKDRKPLKNNYHIVHSSGSTGKPGYFLYDKKAWSSMLLGIIRGALWEMSMSEILKLLAKGPRIVYIAATDGRYGGAMAVGDGIDGVRASQMQLDIKTPLNLWIEKITKFQPNLIIGYPSAIKILAELIEQKKVDLKLIRIITCGEPLGASLRSYLETIFQTKAVNFYGASEALAIGVETDANEGMVLFDDMNIIEVQNGNMYLTSLYNFAQPLIRYRISDSLTLENPPENSRFPFTKAVGLLGRSEDILWFAKDGKREFIHPLAIEGFCIEGLQDYQFKQLSDTSFVMLAR